AVRTEPGPAQAESVRPIPLIPSAPVLAQRFVRVPPFERGLTLGDFLVPIRLGERAASWQRHLLMITAAVVLITLTAQVVIYLPNNPVPITGQTFGVLFSSALLGFRRSLIALAVYLLLG